MSRIVAYGKVENGKLLISKRRQFDNDVHVFEGKEVAITVERKRNTRSLAQNAYYWGVVVPLVKEGLIDTGYQVTTEDVHEYLKSQFNLKELVNEQTGEILQTIGSTSKMSTIEMIEYFSKIQQWSAEYLNTYIPDPNEQTELKFNE